MADSKPLGVAAIDFGTTFSGWAFSFKHDNDIDHTKINVQTKHWYSGKHNTPKTPTVLLIKPDGKTLEAFGYAAQDRYIELSKAKEDRDYFLFSRFRMMLYEQKVITREMKLKAENGKELPAILIFQLAISFLKDNLLKYLENQLDDKMTSDDIYWTLTIPAVWNEKAKTFMREAAMRAGISSHKLSIVLEPESASIFCQHLSQGGHIGTLPVGSTYVLIDCGGGTTDICCHRILDNQTVEEVYRADRGAVGGADVDQSFENFLVKIFGEEVWYEFKRNNGEDFLSLFRTFESKKSGITNTSVILSLPQQLVNLLHSKRYITLQDAVSKAGLRDNISVRGYKLKVSVENMYENVIKRFGDLVSSVSSHPQVQSTDTVLLVGGFSESKLIVDAVRALLPHKQIITIKEPSMAVVKGAVIYGHVESVEQTRRVGVTYGYNNVTNFAATMHDEDMAWMGKDNVERVSLFRRIVTADGPLPDEISGGIIVPIYENQSIITIKIYSVDEADDIPTYTDDSRCIPRMTITAPILNTSVPRQDRRFELTLKFGGTEIRRATAKELLTGNVVEARWTY